MSPRSLIPDRSLEKARPGQLAEVFGPEFVEQDKAARLFLYRGDMKKEWAAYSPDAEAIAAQFAAGINAYIRWLAAHPQQMPYEFKLMKYQPALWSPEDVVRIRIHGLGGNLLKEAERAGVVCVAGWKAEEIRQRLEPPWQTAVPRSGSLFAEKCIEGFLFGDVRRKDRERRNGW